MKGSIRYVIPMQAAPFPQAPHDASSSQEDMVSKCQYCRFYQPEGRRGGGCAQLGVMVQSGWSACALAESPFALAESAPAKESVFIPEFSLRSIESIEQDRRQLTATPS